MANNQKKLKEISDLLNEISKKYLKLGEKNPFKNFNTQNVKDVDKTIEKLEEGLDKVEKKVLTMNTTFGDLHSTLKNIVREFDPKALKATTLLKKGMKGLVDEAQKLANEEEDIGSLSKKNLEKILERAKASKKMAKDNAADIIQGIKLETAKGYTVDATSKSIDRRRKSFKNLSDEQKAAINIYHDENDIQKDLIKKVENRIKLEDDFNKKIGFGGKLAAGLDKALQKAGIPALGISDAIEGARKNFIKTNGTSNVFKDTLKGVAGNLKKAASFANLMQMGFGLLVKSVLEVDKASGEFAKNNGISYQNALAIRGEMNEIARSSNDVVVSSKALMETQGTLNKFFGQSTKFTGKLAEDMTSIAKRTGLSEEAQGVFALEAMKTGKGVKDILRDQSLTVMEMNKQKGLQMSVKQIQEAISKVSNSVFMTFEGNTEELTKQVMSAKALGATMEQVEAISSSLLNFESSIQSELEAELLLGKEINLEKAREAALRGDSAKVAEEVLKNTAIMNAFETKNVIAQEAAAKALGMNRDQLAGMIKEQEKLEAVRSAGFEDMDAAQKAYNKMRADGLSKEEAAAKMKDKDLAAQLESVSAAEKFEGTMMKVQELFVALAEPILAIVQPIADIMVPAITAVADMITYITDSVSGLIGIFTGANEQLSLMQTIVGSIAIGYGSIIAIQKIKQGYDAIALLMEERKNKKQKKGLFGLISEMAMKAFNALGGLPVIGPALGIAAAIAATALGYSYYNKAGDVMSPADGKTQISTKEGGLFELSPNDDLIAAPGAANAMTKKGKKDAQGGGAGGGSAALIAKVEQLITVNRQILAKSSVIEMNGNQVGEEINQSERKVQ